MVQFYRCPHCGNIAYLLNNTGAPVQCCGEPMVKLEPNTTDASAEKHVPQVNVMGMTAHVYVSTAPHPMTDEHYIDWIVLETDQGIQIKYLDGKLDPEAVFVIMPGELVVKAYAYCNLHGLWAEADPEE